MRVDIHELMQQMGMNDTIQPGKRLVKQMAQPGQHKSHSVVCNWLDPKKITIALKAGIKGADLPANELKKYPVTFQSPTFFEISPLSDEEAEHPPKLIQQKTKQNKTDNKGQYARSFSALAKEGYNEEEHGDDTTSSSSGAAEEEGITIHDLREFSSAAEGIVASVGDITRAVIMGMDVAQSAFENVLNAFVDQVKGAKIQATNVLSAAGNYITKYTPPAFLNPTGDETAKYEYSAEKNSAMFTGPNFS